MFSRGPGHKRRPPISFANSAASALLTTSCLDEPLPRNANGKILKEVLRTSFADMN